MISQQVNNNKYDISLEIQRLFKILDNRIKLIKKIKIMRSQVFIQRIIDKRKSNMLRIYKRRIIS